MKPSTKLTQQQLRLTCEARLKRRLTDQEFARLLRLGEGLFWDNQEGAIGPYDMATLQSGRQLIEHLNATRP
jgi:hypothetical protein